LNKIGGAKVWIVSLGAADQGPSRWLVNDWQGFKDQLTMKFLQNPEFQLNEQDHEVMKQALGMIENCYEYKVCHCASCALLASGKFKWSTHVYCRRQHEFSVCAEHGIIERVNHKRQQKKSDDIITIATFHGGHDETGARTKPYLVSPCEKCLRLLYQVSPDALVVCDIDGMGRLAKIPLPAVEFFRHPRTHRK
jgi:cytidine deaminase